MKKRSMVTVMQGAALLSVAALFAKILSAVYRVPFQNMVGNTGFYVFQQIYPIYGIGMVIALSGLPMFISKLVAETPDADAQKGLLWQVGVVLSVGAGVAFLALQLGAYAMAQAMGDTGLAPIIQSVSWMFLLTPFLSVSRGAFQGRFNMLPTATSQLVEQLVRVTVILSVAYVAMTQHWSVYQMGSWAMSSATIAAVFASIVMVFHLWQARPTTPISARFEVSYAVVIKRVLVEGGTISLLASMMVLLQLVDSFTVKKGLVDSGLPDMAAKALKGVFDRGQPLVQLGLVVATALASSLLPGLTDALSHDRFQQFKRLAKTVLRISVVIATAAAVGLVALMPEINRLLFGDTSGTNALNVYVLAIIFATLITILNSILQSLNRFKETVIALLCGLFVKIILTPYLVGIQGINGASWATVLALMVMTAILVISLPEIKMALLDGRLWGKLALTSLVMILGVRLLVVLLVTMSNAVAIPDRILTLFVVTICVPFGAFLFILVALKTQLLTTREWLMVPYGSKLLRRLNR